MKSLTIHQPYAALIAAGLKTIEVRTRPTKYRGLVLIHAGIGNKDMRQYVAGNNDISEALAVAANSRAETIAIRGAAIAVAEIVDCVPFEAKHQRDALVSLAAAPNCYAWHLSNVRLIKPVEYRGQLGLYNVEILLEFL